MEISNLTKKRIIEYLASGNRFDERELLEYRDIKIRTGISNKAEGSAEVSIGKTKVVAGVKMDIAMPYRDSEDEGTLMVTTELSPLASEEFDYGPPSIDAIEIARIVDRGIRESGFIDFKKLCLKKAEEVWCVMIDIYPINDDGNIVDAAALAAVAALCSAVMPETKKRGEKTVVEYGNFTTKKLPLTDIIPITMTFYKIGQSIVLDPTTKEEEATSAKLSIAVSEDKKKEFINALQKAGGDLSSALTQEELHYIFENAVKGQKKLRKIIEEEILEKK